MMAPWNLLSPENGRRFRFGIARQSSLSTAQPHDYLGLFHGSPPDRPRRLNEWRNAVRYSPLPPLPFSVSSPICSTDTTCSSSAVSNTMTP
jgi:hypothetical protein